MKKKFHETPTCVGLTGFVGSLLILGALAFLVPVAKAGTLELPPTEVKAERVDCVPIYLAGEMIMRYRQEGVTLPTMTEMFDEFPALMPTVDEAFRVSEFNLPENQDKAVKEFAEKQYNECEAAQ